MRRGLFVLMMLALLIIRFDPHATQAASAFAAPAFQQQWNTGEAVTPNFWGPLSTAKEGQQEPYKETPGGQRLVQYFDKGRMEMTNGVVTNGLLATEIITGQIQTGDASFQAKPSPAIPIAGDPDNAGPTYAQLNTKGKGLFDGAPQQTGNYTQAALSSGGDISVSSAGPSGPATFALFDSTTKHNVPQAFADYRSKAGLLTIGYALCEPFSATVKVGGTPKQVMVQVFERRVLTYTASNAPAFQVEMGNIGQHYAQWRYASGASPTTTAIASPPAAILNGSSAPIRPGVPPTSAGSCPIIYPVKGMNGTKTYDVPGSATYAGTKPEICFINPTDAEAAGYHAMK